MDARGKRIENTEIEKKKKRKGESERGQAEIREGGKGIEQMT